MKRTIIYNEEKNILHKIFNDLLEVNIDENMRDENVFGKKIDMKPRDLLYVFFEIEKRFNIEIAEEDIVSGSFNTFNNILETILYRLETKNTFKCNAVAE